LNIETKCDLFLGWPDRDDTERDQQERQRGCKQALPRTLIGGEIPSEKNEPGESDKKCERGSHRNFDFRFPIFDLVIASTINASRLQRFTVVQHIRNGRFVDFDLYVVGYFYDHCRILHVRDKTVNAGIGYYTVAGL
jgi:hypothetical protein